MNDCQTHPDSPSRAGPRPAGLARAGALAALLLVCALPRVWLIARTEVIARDGILYTRMAREWRVSPRTVVKSYDYHVGYPVVVAAVQGLREALGCGAAVRDWELSGQIVSLVAGLAAIAGLWAFAGLTFDWRLAAVAAGLFGLGRKWTELGSDVLSDSLAVCFQIWALVLAVLALRAIRRKSNWAIALAAGAGLCGGLGYLVRPEALLAVALAMGLWVAMQIRRPASWRLTLAGVGAAGLAALACALPYILAIGRLTKKKSLSEIVALPPSSRALLATAGIAGADVSSTIQQLATALSELAVNLFDAMHPVLAGLACLWLAAWAADRIVQRRGRPPGELLPRPRPEGALLMAGATLLYGGVAFGLRFHVGYLSHRHVMFLAMLLSPLAAAGLLAAVEGASRAARVPAPWRRAALIVAVAAIAAGLARSARHPLHEGKGYFRQAAGAAAALAGERDFIACDSAWVLHYAQRPGAILPAPLERLTAAGLDTWLRASGATLLVLSDRESGGASAQTRAFLCPPRFVEVASVPGPPAREPDVVRIYRIQESRAQP